MGSFDDFIDECLKEAANEYLAELRDKKIMKNLDVGGKIDRV
jgi:hypothetical protein